MSKELFHFGYQSPGGHGWYGHKRFVENAFPDVNPHVFHYIDDMYTPILGQECEYSEVNISTAKILAWKDYSGDSRPGSNSILIGKGYTTSEEMIADACKKFPEVMRRQNKPLTPLTRPL